MPTCYVLLRTSKCVPLCPIPQLSTIAPGARWSGEGKKEKTSWFVVTSPSYHRPRIRPPPHVSSTCPAHAAYPLPHLMRARTVPGKGPKVLDGSSTGRCSLRRVALRRRTLHMRRFLPSYAVAASCPGDFLRLHGRIAPSVSMVRGICAWSDLGCVTVWWGLD
jgi:hypothetical protein